MSIADPISPAFALINSTLRADATFMAQVQGVYQGMAPDVAYTKPFCVMSYQSGQDTNTATGAYRILSRLIMQVQIVGLGSDGAAVRAAFARMDGVLMPIGRALLEHGGTLALYRTSTISYEESVSGAIWTHLGGLYRVEV
jgi:hypothetical protein